MLTHWPRWFLLVVSVSTSESRYDLAMHMMHEHSQKSVARSKVETTHCPFCLVEHWARMRLVKHLSVAKACKHYVETMLPSLSPERVAQLDADDATNCTALRRRGLKRTYAEQPCVRIIYGPVRKSDTQAADTKHPLDIARKRHGIT